MDKRRLTIIRAEIEAEVAKMRSDFMRGFYAREIDAMMRNVESQQALQQIQLPPEPIEEVDDGIIEMDTDAIPVPDVEVEDG